MKLTEIAFRNIKRNKRRSFLSGIAISISVMTIVFMFALIDGMMGDYQANVQNYLTGDIRIRHKGFNDNERQSPLHLNLQNSDKLVKEIESMENVTAATRRISFGTAIYGSPMLGRRDIVNFPDFIRLLSAETTPLAGFLMSKASPDLKNRLKTASESGSITREQKTELMDYLNKLLRSETITEHVNVKKEILPEEARLMLEKGISIKNRDRYNRIVLETLLSEQIDPGTRMGKSFLGFGVGMDFSREKNFINPGEKLDDGRLPADGENEILLSSGLAAEMNLWIGDKITLYTKTSDSSMNAVTLRITGIKTFSMAGYNDKLFFLPIDTTQKLLRMDDAAIDILIKTRGAAKIPGMVEKLKKTIGILGYENVMVSPWWSIGIYFPLITMAWTAYLFIAAFFFILGSTVIINTTMMIIFERIREIGTISAMGMKGKEIVRLFFLEAFYIAMIAAGAGVVAGILIIVPFSIFGLDFTTAMEGMDFEINTVIYPKINILITLFVFIYSVIISSAASLLPSKRASKIKPVEALRTI